MTFITGSLPQYCCTLDSFDFQTMSLQSCKNASFNWAVGFYDQNIGAALKHLRSLISKQYRSTLVDVKLHSLSSGDVPCLPGWHLDGGPAHSSEYALCVAGASHTQFLNKQISMLSNKNVKILCHDLNRLIDNWKFDYFSVKDWQVFKYDNLTPHRGGVAIRDGKRLLLRVMAQIN